MTPPALCSDPRKKGESYARHRTVQGYLGTHATVDGDRRDARRQGPARTVRVHAGDGPFACPECQTKVPGYDRKLRRWRHLDACQFTTWIEADVPLGSS